MEFVLVNSFSLNMLPNAARNLAMIPISPAAARNLVINERARCAIGHADTARVADGILEMPERADEWAQIAETRPSVTMTSGVSLIVAQYTGPRLPAGATTLPDGARIEFWQVYDY